MISNSLRSIFISALLFTACATNSRAASFDYVDTSGELVGFNPGHVVFDADGAWVTGNATARFRVDGSLAFAVPVALAGGDALLAETVDGGLVEAPLAIIGTPQLLPCSVFKLGPTGALQWSDDLPGGGHCVSVASDNSGVIWILQASYGGLGRDLFRIEADGSGLSQITMPAGFFPIAFQAPLAVAGDGIYLAGATSLSDPNAHGSVLKLDSVGAVIWQWSDPAAGNSLAQVALDASGNVYASGSDTAQSGSSLVSCSLTPAGLKRWCQRYDLPGAISASGFEVAADGTSFVLDTVPNVGPRVLAKINADGSLAWQRNLPLQELGTPLSQVDGRSGLRIAPNGDALALSDSRASDTSPATTQLFRFDADGNIIATSTLTGRPGATAVGVSDMKILADSSTLITTYSNFPGAVSSAIGNGLFLHLDRAGQPLPNPFASVNLSANGVVLDSIIDADGTTYLLTQNLLTQFNREQDGVYAALNAQYALSKISPDGVRLWKSYWDGYWWTAHLSDGADRICIGGNLAAYWLPSYFSDTPPAGATPDTRIDCHATGTGALLWSSELQPAYASYSNPVALRVLGDSNTVAVYANASGQGQLTVLDAAGNKSQTHPVPVSNFPVGIGVDGSALFVGTGSVPSLTVVRADGTTAYELSLTSMQAIGAAEYLDDATVDVLGFTPDGRLLIGLVSASGALQWTTQVADAANGSSPLRFSATANQGDIFLALSDGQTNTRLLWLNRASGAIVWEKTTVQTSAAFGLVVDPNSSDLIFYNVYTHKIGIQIVDPASGNFRALSYRTCGNADCAKISLQRAQASSDGTLRMVLSSTDFPSVLPADPPQVIGIDLAPLPPLIPAAQPGVAGAWFAPYESGQGFVIDYIADANVLFIPWFTYMQNSGNDPAGLAWFTLQGTVTSGATEVDLAIGSNDGGIFQSGTTAAHQVGSGHISFFDCDRGSLSYQFDSDVNGGASGLISIVRLSPSTSVCKLANGSALPAENTNPASNGFDAHQSGSWFNPNTSGQGIQFTVIPSGGGFPGLLYGAWFTFDPAGAFDDPLHQHWFTLQGELSNATNGQVTVPIVGTIGGTFDNAPTGNSVRVGQATVTFVGCANATVDYQFDDASVAHAYRDLSGSMSLSKIGGCAN